MSKLCAAGIPYGSVNLLHGVDENESKVGCRNFTQYLERCICWSSNNTT